MADEYIDINEMGRYGDHFTSAAQPYLNLDPYPARLTSSMQAMQTQIASLTLLKQDTTSSSTSSHKVQRSQSAEIQRTLDSLFADLKSAQKKGMVFNFTDFFPTQRLSDIGLSIADRKAALERCQNALKNNPGIPDAATWQTTLTNLLASVTTVVSTTSASDSSRNQQFKVFEALRPQWMATYLACKRGMESVLLLAGRANELKSLFLDLQQGSPSSSGTPTTSTGGEASGG